LYHFGQIFCPGSFLRYFLKAEDELQVKEEWVSLSSIILVSWVKECWWRGGLFLFCKDLNPSWWDDNQVCWPLINCPALSNRIRWILKKTFWPQKCIRFIVNKLTFMNTIDFRWYDIYSSDDILRKNLKRNFILQTSN